MTEDNKRKEWISYWKEDKNNMPFPQHLHNLQCGAKTRAGAACKLRSLYANARCKYHGGLSTGARTEEGKRKVALNGFKKDWRKQSPCRHDKT